MFDGFAMAGVKRSLPQVSHAPGEVVNTCITRRQRKNVSESRLKPSRKSDILNLVGTMWQSLRHCMLYFKEIPYSFNAIDMTFGQYYFGEITMRNL